MLIFPSKMKFKKYQKQKRRFRGIDVDYSFPKTEIYGLKVLSTGRVFNFHLESIRKLVQRRLKKGSMDKLKICIFTDLPLTKKSSGLRMGKGKGDIEYWCFPVFKGRIVFEININSSFNVAKKFFYNVKERLSLGVKFVRRKKFMLT